MFFRDTIIISQLAGFLTACMASYIQYQAYGGMFYEGIYGVFSYLYSTNLNMQSSYGRTLSTMRRTRLQTGGLYQQLGITVAPTSTCGLSTQLGSALTNNQANMLIATLDPATASPYSRVGPGAGCPCRYNNASLGVSLSTPILLAAVSLMLFY